jgi:HEAT repeat protein
MPVPPQAPTVTPDGDRLYGEEPPPLPAQGPRARTELFGGLARALADPDEIVRERALDALAGARGLLPWVRSELRIGDRENAESAAAVVQVLGLNEAAGDLLERASGLPRELRGAFIDALAAIRLEASELAELARSVEVSRRHEAVRLVGEIGGAAVAPYMKSFLSESSGPVRIAALELLGRSPGPDLRDVAEQVLRKDSSPAVRATAVRVLGSIDDPEGRLRSLAQALNDADPDVRSTAVEALGTDTEAGAATLLLAAAEDDDERVRVAALRCLSHLRRDPKVMWSALVKSSEREREQMIAMLEDRGAEELGLLASEYLDSRNPDDRALAVTLAGRAGTPATIRKTIAALRDPEKAVRSAAAHALSELRTPEAIPALAYTLKDPDPGVRIQAVRALGVIDDDEVIPVLIDSLKDPEARVRDEASDVVQRWRSPAVARRLVQALSAGDLSRPASDLLARMGETALEPILERLPDCDPDFLPVLGELLSAIVGPDVFVDDLGSLDPDLRSRAVESLGAMGGAKAVDGLIRVLSDPDERIRKAALVHLGRLGDQRAYDEVRRAFANDPVLEVVEAAEETLHALEPGESFPQL